MNIKGFGILKKKSSSLRRRQSHSTSLDPQPKKYLSLNVFLFFFSFQLFYGPKQNFIICSNDEINVGSHKKKSAESNKLLLK